MPPIWFDPAVIEAVADADIIFGCVDSAEARDVLNRVSTHYLIPYIDVGVQIGALPDGTIDRIDGVVHYIQPGGSSLLAREAYRVSQVSADALKRRNPPSMPSACAKSTSPAPTKRRPPSSAST